MDMQSPKIGPKMAFKTNLHKLALDCQKLTSQIGGGGGDLRRDRQYNPYKKLTTAIYNPYKDGGLSVRIEASIFSIQRLSTTLTYKAGSLSTWGLTSFLYNSYIQFTRRQALYQNGGFHLSIERLYTIYMQTQTPCQNAGFHRFYASAIYDPYKESRLSVKMEASLFPIQLLHTLHIQANSVSE